jgi:hypothetical protein
MGQYYRVVNHDRKEYIDPRYRKLTAIQANLSGLLPYLLRESDGRGGGDPTVPGSEAKAEDGAFNEKIFREKVAERWPNEGRWAGDAISVVGDYSDTGLFETVECSGEWTEITDEVVKEAKRFAEGPATPKGAEIRLNPTMNPDVVLEA